MEQERQPAAPHKKRRWLGTAIALLLIAGLGALAWHLTPRPRAIATAPAQAARRGQAARAARAARAGPTGAKTDRTPPPSASPP